MEATEKLKKRMGGYPEADEEQAEAEARDAGGEPEKKVGSSFGVSQNRIKEAFKTTTEPSASADEEEGWLDGSFNFVSGLFGMGVDGENEYGKKGIERAAMRLGRSSRKAKSSSNFGQESESAKVSSAQKGLREGSARYKDSQSGRFKSGRSVDDDDNGENERGPTRDDPRRVSLGRSEPSSAPAGGGSIRAVQDVREHRNAKVGDAYPKEASSKTASASGGGGSGASSGDKGESYDVKG